jgi:DNA-binding PucR family transcriptional regulator
MNSQSADDTWVSVFQDSVLGVAAVSAPDVTRKLAEITLGSFGDLQQEEKQSLLETFAVWLDHKGSVSETAAAMFCHPNTVRNRLRRIEDRTGRSLSAPLELAELCLAFEVAKTMPQ